MKNIWFILILVLSIAGCSTAGPFVTSVSSDGRGGLVVEKTMVQYNGFTGPISQKDATSANIQVIPRD